MVLIEILMKSQLFMMLKLSSSFKLYSNIKFLTFSFKEVCQNLDENQFLRDFHLDDLLVFPAHTDFHDSRLVQDSRVILQDKVKLILKKKSRHSFHCYSSWTSVDLVFFLKKNVTVFGYICNLFYLRQFGDLKSFPTVRNIA